MTALPRTIAVALALVVAAPGSAHASSSWRARWRAGLDAGWLAHPGARGGTARAGTLATGDGPAFVALDPATRTLYVSNGAADSVAVLDVSRCTARDPSGCGDPVATVKVGPFPFGLVLDARTHTLYAAASGDRTVSVVDVSHCTAGDVTGCHRPPATVPVDADPAILALDAATDTVYVMPRPVRSRSTPPSTRRRARCTSRMPTTTRARPCR